jgi:integrase/recombinase XerD
LRVKNLLAIEIGVHLQLVGGQAMLAFQASETKQKRPVFMSWPPALVPALMRYLQQARPALLAARGPRDPARPHRAAGTNLWVGQGGTPLTPGGLQKLLLRHTRRRFGHFINAHLFRDCTATTLANQDPNHVHHAAPLLGHADLWMTERGYIASDSRIALQRHHDLMSAIRARARPQPPTEQDE